MAGEQADQADQARDIDVVRRTVSSPVVPPQVLDRSTSSDDGASKAPSILNFKRVLSVDSGSSFLADLAASQQTCPVRALLVRVKSTSSETRDTLSSIHNTMDSAQKVRDSIRGLFRAWFAGLSGAALDAKILEVFQQFDTDNSGYLEFDEFKMACEKMGLSLADDDLKALVREFDQDGDEQISFDEFRHAVKVQLGRPCGRECETCKIVNPNNQPETFYQRRWGEAHPVATTAAAETLQGCLRRIQMPQDQLDAIFGKEFLRQHAREHDEGQHGGPVVGSVAAKALAEGHSHADSSHGVICTVQCKAKAAAASAAAAAASAAEEEEKKRVAAIEQEAARLARERNALADREKRILTTALEQADMLDADEEEKKRVAALMAAAAKRRPVTRGIAQVLATPRSLVKFQTPAPTLKRSSSDPGQLQTGTMYDVLKGMREASGLESVRQSGLWGAGERSSSRMRTPLNARRLEGLTPRFLESQVSYVPCSKRGERPKNLALTQSVPIVL